MFLTTTLSRSIRLITAMLLLLCEQSLAQTPLEEARTLSKRAVELNQSGKTGEALALARRSLTIFEQSLPAEHPDTATALYDVGYYAQVLGNLSEGGALLTRALQMREKTLPLGHPDIAQSLSGLAVLRQVQGHLREAEPLYKRALEIRERALGPGHSLVALSLNNLAYLYQIQGQSSQAEPLHKRALEIWEKTLAPGHPQLAWSLVNLGILYVEQGRLDDAEPLQRRALEIREQALPAGHPDVGRSLVLLANIRAKRGRLEEAEELLEKALVLLEKALPSIHPDIALNLNNLAILYDRQGRLAEAETAYSRALEIREKGLPAGHVDIATSLNNLGILYRRQGRLAEAERLAIRALELRQAALPSDHPHVVQSISSLAVLRMNREDWAAAHGFLLQSADLQISRGRRDSEAFQALRSSDTSSSEIRSAFHIFQSVIKVAHRLSKSLDPKRTLDLEAQTFTLAQWAVLSNTAASLTRMAARNASGDPKFAVLVRERQDLVSEWEQRDRALLIAAALPNSGRDAGAEKSLRDRIGAIDLRVAEIDRTLSRDFPSYARLASPEPLSIGEVQKLLHSDEALVFMVDTEWMSSTLPEETFVWVVTNRDVRRVRSDFGTKALTERVADLRCGLDAAAWNDEQASGCGASPGQTFTIADARAGKQLPFDTVRAYELYQQLFGQVEDLIAGKHLLIVPSGPLTSLPLHVLVKRDPRAGSESGTRSTRDTPWLVRYHALTVLPAVSSLKALRRVAKPSAARQPMIGFGNPLLDGDQGHPRYGSYYKGLAAVARARIDCAQAAAHRTDAPRGASLSPAPISQQSGLADVAQIRQQSPLPETADELCAVARDLQSDVNEVRLGARASEREVKALSASGRLADYRILHFATHGTLARQLSGTSEPGLILTPPATATAEDDGYLSAVEIAALKLDAEWVILSACNTAGPAGGFDGAEALSGLARAFFYAQARALLVSHWEVNSKATVELVTSAVGAIANDKSVGRAEALRRAMLAMIEGGQPHEAHPAYWAPFIVVGEGAAVK